MTTSRFWIGCVLGLSLAWALLMVVLLPGCNHDSQGLVWGQVKYNGQPVTDGTIFFIPVGPKAGNWVIASLNRDGSYTAHSYRDWNGSSKVLHKISLIPDVAKTHSQPSSSPIPSSPPQPPKLSRREEAGKTPAPKKSVAPDARQTPAPDAGRPSLIPHRYSDIQTSGLEVSLGPEPVRLDLYLTD
jgi:hypothetical protein